MPRSLEAASPGSAAGLSGSPRAVAIAAQNPELEAAILADIENPAARLIYADWLQGQGDPRGELIAIQVALADARGARATRLRQKENVLLGEHRGHLVPQRLREAMDDHMQRRPEQSGKVGRWERGACSISWQGGFIDHARIARYGYGEEPIRVEERIEDLCQHPSGRFLRELEIGPLGVDDTFDYGTVVDTLARQRLPVLRSLVLADFESEDCELSWSSLGDLGLLWQAVPGLEDMYVQGGSFSLGTIDLPRVRRFTVHTGGLGKPGIASICRARWPQLERLEIWFGRSRFGAEGEIDDIRPILEGQGLGQLTSLGLMNAEFTDDICEALPGSPIAGQLVDLDLSLGTMSDEGARALASDPRAFPRLQWLRVGDNYLSDASRRRLGKLAKNVVWGFQDDADEWDGDRYASVGE